MARMADDKDAEQPGEGEGEGEGEAPPEEEAEAPREPPFIVLLAEEQAAFYEYEDVDERAAFVAQCLKLEDHTGHARSAVKVDLVTYTLDMARSSGQTPETTAAMLSIACEAVDEIGNGAAAQEVQAAVQSKLVAIAKPRAVLGQPCLVPADAPTVAKYFADGIVRHFNLYKYMFTQEQELEARNTHRIVEEPAVPQPLLLSRTQEELDAHNAALEEARLAEEERLAEEAAAAKAAAEEEERLRKEAEEAAAAEAAAAEKKEPQNVDEAVDFSAEKRVEEVKKELSALYKAREEELLAKIAALEAKLGG